MVRTGAWARAWSGGGGEGRQRQLQLQSHCLVSCASHWHHAPPSKVELTSSQNPKIEKEESQDEGKHSQAHPCSSRRRAAILREYRTGQSSSSSKPLTASGLNNHHPNRTLPPLETKPTKPPGRRHFKLVVPLLGKRDSSNPLLAGQMSMPKVGLVKSPQVHPSVHQRRHRPSNSGLSGFCRVMLSAKATPSRCFSKACRPNRFLASVYTQPRPVNTSLTDDTSPHAR